MKLIILTFGLIAFASGTVLICEFKTVFWYNDLDMDLKTCFIEYQAIAESNSIVKLHIDKTAKGMMMQNNKQVKHVPVNLKDAMPNLKGIDFEGCAISSIDDQFKGLQELVVLWLSQNQIETISSEAFADNVKLEYISLWYNKLKVVNDQHFKSLKNLKHLYLQENEIEFIDPSAFLNLINLERLDLDNNKLTFIDAKTFQSLKKLMKLYLNYNQIETIDSGSFDRLKSLKYVGLDGNICITKNYDASKFSNMRNTLRNCKPDEVKFKKMQDQVDNVMEIQKYKFDYLTRQNQKIETVIKEEFKQFETKSNLILAILAKVRT